MNSVSGLNTQLLEKRQDRKRNIIAKVVKAKNSKLPPGAKLKRYVLSEMHKFGNL